MMRSRRIRFLSLALGLLLVSASLQLWRRSRRA